MYKNETGLEIAVIGLAGKFPGAKNVQEYWTNLVNGKEMLEFLSDEELEKVPAGLKLNPSYVNAKGGVIKDKEYFDEAFFGYTPNEAKLMDPQVRVMHELVWEALEDAGYNSSEYEGRIAFYGGASQNLRWQAMAFQSEEGKMLGDFSSTLLTSKDFICTRISYKLNLKGPSVYVSTACSTSLVAVHLACRALLSGECSLALAGGISLSATPRLGYIYQQGMINSSDGRCRSFDAQSTGTVNGEGGGVVVLKLLEDARKDGDHIYAVIKGSAVNNDGNVKVGFTAPSVESQSQVIQAALNFSDVDPETITYVETHGSGTALGDPIEIDALKRAFNSSRRNFCAIGSVKTNMGHLDAGAGISSFIKCVLSLRNKQIPESLNFSNPNPAIDFNNSPFYVNTSLQQWKKMEFPRRAGVSSFGIGGTNVHVVLEEYETDSAQTAEEKPRLFLLSAKSAEALDEATQKFQEFVSHNPVDLDDVAYTLQVGRRHFNYRRTLVASTQSELEEALRNSDSKKIQTFYSNDVKRDVIFMFPGIGSQYGNMARSLYDNEPAFAHHVDACITIIDEHTGSDFKEVLYPRTSVEVFTEIDFEKSQLMTFVIEYALAKLLIGWGVKPGGLIGYSFGEYVAACLAGVFTLEDALRLVIKRGALVKNITSGEMLSIPLPEDRVLSYLTPGVSVTISNGPSTIVAGAKEAIEEVHNRLRNGGFLCMKVNTQYAIHSPMAESIVDDFRNLLTGVKFAEPAIPMMLNLTGAWAKSGEVSTPEYWVKHLIHTVKFGKGLSELMKSEDSIFVEIGPGRSLSNMLRQLPERKMSHLVGQTLPGSAESANDHRFFLARLGQLWLYNQTIDWRAVQNGNTCRRISLPTYPFQRNRHWLDEPTQWNNKKPDEGLRSARQKNIADWFYVPTWKRSSLAPASGVSAANNLVMLFSTEHKAVKSIQNEMSSGAQKHIIVLQGKAYAKLGERTYSINPKHAEHYQNLFRDLSAQHLLPTQIVHAWNVTNDFKNTPTWEDVEKTQYTGLYSILFLIKALVAHKPERLSLNILGNHLFQVTGEENIDPAKATLQGILPVIQQEFSFIRCALTDIDTNGTVTQELMLQLAQENTDLCIAYRGRFRWVQDYQAVALPPPAEKSPVFRKKGVYLITGGLGKIGLAIASCLSREVQAKVILVSRSAFPPSSEWKILKSAPDTDQALKNQIDQLMTIQENGGEIIIYQADVGNKDAMAEVKNAAQDKFGKVNGVIHAAGVVKGKSIQCPLLETTVQECLDQFQPKVKGTLVLKELFDNEPLDFILCTSSLSPILGGLGFFAYASSSSFIDAFVVSQNDGSPWIGVNWADWKFSETSATTTKGDFTITADEGIETLKRIVLNTSARQIVVSAGLLHERINQWVKLQQVRNEQPQTSEKILQKRPTLINPYVSSRTKIEGKIAELWGNLFGYDQIGVHDNFFELGGDSLKALVMLSRIHKQFGEVLPLGDFFKEATIENTARLLGQNNKKKMLTLRQAEKKEYYRLSSAQRRLFFHQLLNPDSVAYNETRIIDLDDISYDQVVLLLNDLVKRHELFRTTIHLVQDQPAQIIHDSLTILPDTIACSEAEVEEHILEFIKPFVLAELPLLRTRLLDIQSGRKVLLVDMPHIITDGVSTSIFFEEFFKLYNKQLLPAIEYNFKDFCEWQFKEARTAKIQQQKQYWREKLMPMREGFILPTDTANASDGGGTRIVAPVNIGSIDEVNAMLANFNATYFTLMLSCFFVLLSKVSNKSKIVVGTATSGRNLADLENTLGLFINIIPLYKEVRSDITFADFLNQVVADTMKDFDHQDLHFEDLMKALTTPNTNTNSNNTLFNVMLVSYVGKYKTEGKIQKATKYLSDVNSSRYDLTLLLVQDDDHYKMSAEFNSNSFKTETIARMMNCLNMIYRQVVSRPTIKIGEISLLDESVRSKVLQQMKAKSVVPHAVCAPAPATETVDFQFD